MLSRHRADWLAFLGAFAAAMIFAVYTRLAWDDWYITYRASKNLALGYGLTFTPGEHVHSFTSPAGTVIPALLSYIVGNANDDLVLWLYRIFSATLLGVAAMLTVRLAARIGLMPWVTIVLIVTAFLDAKLLANSINGMETAILMLFFVLTLYAFLLPVSRRSAILMGIGWAGLMWSRPDGIVDFAAITLGYAAFGAEGGWRSRIALWKVLVPAGLMVVIFYGPWLVWAQLYYGSFVPNTIIAKGLSHHPSLASMTGWEARAHVVRFLTARSMNWSGTLMPPYSITFGGWPWVFVNFSRVMTFVASFAWIVPWFRRPGRWLALTLLILEIYLEFGMEYAFPWYFPPAAFLVMVVFAIALDQILRMLMARASAGRLSPRAPQALQVLAGGGVALMVAAITTVAAAQLRVFQTINYDSNYKLVGEWLHDHARSPRDTVFLEPLGYIAFYSGLKMYDYPGLSSKEMIAARRHFPMRDLTSREIFADLIPYMRPTWAVLRPREIELITARRPGLLTETYHPVRTFDVSDRIAAVRLPGKPWFQLDQTFVIFHRAVP